jgi:hypothetical protein
MPIGHTKSLTMKAIREKASTLKEICVLYGMGSFFRSNSFNDLDLVAVVDCGRGELADTAKRIHSAFRELGARLGVPIDLTIFTPTEFSRAPLRDMSTLVKLYDPALSE